MITLRNVSKTYATNRGPHVVLSGVTAHIPPLTSYGILGKNGSGKSTLLRLISGIEAPDTGEVIRKGRLSWPIGFSGGFNGSLTGEENCRFIARIHGEDIDRVVGFTREFAELGDYFYNPIKTYSSGMKARFGFSVSMAIEFDVYLVDEVTAVGDRRFAQKCRTAFSQRRARSSVIMVSHNLKTIRGYADRAAVLQDGELTLFDSVDEAVRAYGD